MINATHKPYQGLAFCASKNGKNETQNPISKGGEKATLFKATAIAGLGFGGRALWYLYEDTNILERTFKLSGKLVDKNKQNATGINKKLLHLGAWGAILIGFVGAVAAAYTLFKAPEVAYKGKVNAFVKGKDMDVYVKSNNVEKELYNQMNEKAKNATAEEKKVLAQQYLKLIAAKNEVPNSIKKQGM